LPAPLYLSYENSHQGTKVHQGFIKKFGVLMSWKQDFLHLNARVLAESSWVLLFQNEKYP
jgi:hypothetical protein